MCFNALVLYMKLENAVILLESVTFPSITREGFQAVKQKKYIYILTRCIVQPEKKEKKNRKKGPPRRNLKFKPLSVCPFHPRQKFRRVYRVERDWKRGIYAKISLFPGQGYGSLAPGMHELWKPTWHERGNLSAVKIICVEDKIFLVQMQSDIQIGARKIDRSFKNVKKNSEVWVKIIYYFFFFLESTFCWVLN